MANYLMKLLNRFLTPNMRVSGTIITVQNSNVAKICDTVIELYCGFETSL
jgi:hypothetical protein